MPIDCSVKEQFHFDNPSKIPLDPFMPQRVPLKKGEVENGSIATYGCPCCAFSVKE